MTAFRTADGLMQIAAVHFRDADNDLVDAAAVQGRNAANALKLFFSAFSASLTLDSVAGYGNSGSTPDISTLVVGVVVDGGVAPFTYLWTRTDGGGDSWTIGNDTAATTDFTALDVAGSASAEFICTVTDNIGAIAVAGPVEASAINLGGIL